MLLLGHEWGVWQRRTKLETYEVADMFARIGIVMIVVQ